MSNTVERAWLAPARTHFPRDHIDLGIGQHAAGALREGWHRRAVHAVGDRPADGDVIRDGEIHGIGERNRRAATSIRTVTAGAVLWIESVEHQDFVRRQLFRAFAWLSGRGTTR